MLCGKPNCSSDCFNRSANLQWLGVQNAITTKPQRSIAVAGIQGSNMSFVSNGKGNSAVDP